VGEDGLYYRFVASLPEPEWLYQRMLDSVHEAVRVLSRPPHSKRRSQFLERAQILEGELRSHPHPKSGHWKYLFNEFGVPDQRVARAGNTVAAVETYEATGELPDDVRPPQNHG
jgi:hypothetical protein